MEIEAKYRLTATVTSDQIEAIPWTPYYLNAQQTVDQHDTFYDTADLQLSRSRHAVRVRDLGDRLLVTLKGPGSVSNGVHRRAEWEAPTPDRDPAAWPSLIADRLRDLIGSPTLQPLLDVQNQRTTWELWRDDQLIGEVALDRGTISANDRHEPMHELEIELKGGTPADLDQIATLIHQHLPAVPEDRSKFARGLALARPDLIRSADQLEQAHEQT